MDPVLTPSEMREVDSAAAVPVDVLIDRAGAAVARAAIDMLGGTYGRRVAVIAGPGNNGADGRVAAARLERRGVRTIVGSPDAPPPPGRGVDLVIDAAFGTGFRGTVSMPAVSAPVLAVDVPSGVDGLTGETHGAPLRADRTVTFAALKPGLLFGRGAELAGEVEIADIGLDVGRTRCWRVTDDDLVSTWMRRGPNSHKWRSAVHVVGGSAGMTGAPFLAATGALRTGAGYVRISVPGSSVCPAPPEAVTAALPAVGWSDAVLDDQYRFAAMVVGPGLGRSAESGRSVHDLVARLGVTAVVDGDGLWALGSGMDRQAGAAAAAPSPSVPIVLTPHDGEYERLCGHRPGPDRVAAARRLAVDRGAVVLLKGPATVIADVTGDAFIVTSGDQRLATAGSGDVLSGMVAARLAAGHDATEAAWLAAHAHGLAGCVTSRTGATASDVAEAAPAVLDELLASGRRPLVSGGPGPRRRT